MLDALPLHFIFVANNTGQNLCAGTVRRRKGGSAMGDIARIARVQVVADDATKRLVEFVVPDV